MDEPEQQDFLEPGGAPPEPQPPSSEPANRGIDTGMKWRALIVAVFFFCSVAVVYVLARTADSRDAAEGPKASSAPPAQPSRSASPTPTSETLAVSGTAGALPIKTGSTVAALTATSSAMASGTRGESKTAAPVRYAWNSIKTTEPIIALTFDDGPHPVNTPKLLDILAQRKIKATFFLIGSNAERYPEIVKRIAAEGHEIGNHTWTHPNLGVMPDQKVRAELWETDQMITKILGTRPTLMRPPYGSLAQQQRRWVANEFGYKIIIWSVDPFDWKNPGPSVVAERILSRAQKGCIILTHDIHAGTITAMPQVLDTLLAKGYKFLTVSELLAQDHADLKPPVTGTSAGASLPASASAR